jgi:hypothetical protein
MSFWEIFGLKGASPYNNMRCIAHRFDKDLGKWVVTVDDAMKTSLVVRPENLRKAPSSYERCESCHTDSHELVLCKVCNGVFVCSNACLDEHLRGAECKKSRPDDVNITLLVSRNKQQQLVVATSNGGSVLASPMQIVKLLIDNNFIRTFPGQCFTAELLLGPQGLQASQETYPVYVAKEVLRVFCRDQVVRTACLMHVGSEDPRFDPMLALPIAVGNHVVRIVVTPTQPIRNTSQQMTGFQVAVLGEAAVRQPLTGWTTITSL